MTLSFYDAAADVLVVRFANSDDPNGERRSWGTLMRDFDSGVPLSAELWAASKLLPGSLLEGVPSMAESDRADDLGYFDREVRILWFRTGESERPYGQEHKWGLFHRDRETGAVIGVELWEADKYLPTDLLDCLPTPPASGS